MADTERAIRVVLQGQSGEIVVNGKTYNGTMIPLNNLSDEEVANVLTYVRNSWGNNANAVTPEAVRRIRSETPTQVADQYE
jgi:nitrite reductase (NO-forming)